MAPAKAAEKPTAAAHYKGVDVPPSPFMNEMRIKRINAGRYEGQEIAGGLAVVQKGDTVLELGAGIGVVGAVVSKNCVPKKHVAFEANPNLIPHIEEIYKLNKLTRRSKVRNEVLMSDTDRPEHVSFYLHKSFLGSSLTKENKREGSEVSVPTASLEVTMEELKPDVVLMDIEGGELDILPHMDLTHVRAVVVEFHPGVYEREGMITCKDVLRQAGFSPIKDLSTRMVWVATRD